MTSRITEFLTRRRSGKEWAVLAILAIALAVEMLNAGIGLPSLGGDRLFASESIVDMADVAVVLAAAWLIRL